MTAWRKTNDRRKLTGRPWRRLREQVMNRDRWLCQVCLAAGRLRPAEEIDHLKPLAAGGDDSLANLQAICRACHATKSIEDRGGTPRKRIGADGWPVE